MATTAERPPVGTMLRDWRQRRRLSQLDLALEAGVSARHLSFIETGRSKPSAEMLAGLAEQLEIPLLAFLGTLTRFGTAVDVTVSELSIESFFPADAHTAEYVRAAVEA
jgi:transcriptional regulator with XRE-family HTH domain